MIERAISGKCRQSMHAAVKTQSHLPQAGEATNNAGVFLRLRGKHLRSTCGSQGMGERRTAYPFFYTLPGYFWRGFPQCVVPEMRGVRPLRANCFVAR